MFTDSCPDTSTFSEIFVWETFNSQYGKNAGKYFAHPFPVSLILDFNIQYPNSTPNFAPDKIYLTLLKAANYTSLLNLIHQFVVDCFTTTSFNTSETPFLTHLWNQTPLELKVSIKKSFPNNVTHLFAALRFSSKKLIANKYLVYVFVESKKHEKDE